MIQELVDRYCAMKPPYYVRQYERLLVPMRDRVKRVMEIGIQGGGSLRVWRDMFPCAEIIGFDIVDFKIAEPRITAIVGDQSSDADLARAAERGPFDLIIDDGSHVPAHWHGTFMSLRGRLNPGGLYVIEDLRAPMQIHPGFTLRDRDDMDKYLLAITMENMRGSSEWDRIELHHHMLVLHKFDPAEQANDKPCWWEERK